MKQSDSGLRLSASDLSNHLGCRHLTQLNVAVAKGTLAAPSFRDPSLSLLQARGYAHEAAYVADLRRQGMEVVELEPSGPDGMSETLVAMQRGVDVIAQATLVSGRWLGYADVLRKVAVPSKLGDYSYEVQDTKLSRTTKTGAVLQLCLYSDIVGELQGLLPEHMYVISPGTDFVAHELRGLDYMAYYRWVRAKLEASIEGGASTYPEPAERCDICNWRFACDERRRRDDHLSLVAGITRTQRRELSSRNVLTLAGLARLPQPSPGDIFFDFEGDAFVEGGGLEYLWGYGYREGGQFVYRSTWALSREEERRAFEGFMEELMVRWTQAPDMHVYHFAPYEPAALKRLMSRFASRGDELDQMLRGELFVDLYAVVRHGLRASVESYSIKKLEPFFGFERDVALPDVGPAKRELEGALELATPSSPPVIEKEWRDVVEAYNRDDCRSALGLRDWLENLRAEAVLQGHAIPRPPPGKTEGAPEKKAEREETQKRRAKLMEGVPKALEERTPEDKAKALLADLLEFHRREENVAWWEYYRLRDMAPEDLADERKAISGLVFDRRVQPKTRTLPVDRYRFPPQDVDLDEGDSLETPKGAEESKPFGTVVALDVAEGWVDVKKTKKTEDVHAEAVFSCDVYDAPEAAASLARLGDWVAFHGVDAPGEYRAARDLLLQAKPRLRQGGKGLARQPGETTEAHARRVALEVEDGVLPVQGPPGAGKTYAGARMILELVKAGRRVGVTAVSHKVITGLLEEVLAAAKKERVTVLVGRKIKSGEKPQPGPIQEFAKLADAKKALASGTIQVLGGTAWAWAPEDMKESIDVLFIDEAGQLSLANALAVAQAARSLVLLGDPRQLEQPKKGSHPDGAEVSALEHLLGGAQTVPERAGLFLGETYRLSPAICQFTSELFYEGRLRSAAGCDRLRAEAGPLVGAGLWFLAVEHESNANKSPEEVKAVRRLVEQLLAPGSTWVDAEGKRQPLSAQDVMVVAPYNAQVSALKARLPADVRVGTVDLFQGREAAVVVVSMTSSSAEEAPRGMEFLYSLNRLNVATSRAKAACVLVASPRLFEAECRTPRQMQLANALCRYREMAKGL